MFGLLAENFDDVLESVLSSLEETLSKDDSAEKLKRNVLRNSYNPFGTPDYPSHCLWC